MAAGSLPGEHSQLALEFVGLVGLEDPLRATVPAAVAECRTAGIRIVMITGDYPATAQSIARQAGLANPERIITGPELERIPTRTSRSRSSKCRYLPASCRSRSCAS